MAIVGTSGTIVISGSVVSADPVARFGTSLGGAQPLYVIGLYTPSGQLITIPKDYVKISWNRVEMNYGVARITLPGYYPPSVIEQEDGIVSIQRGYSSSNLPLLNDTLYMRVGWKLIQENSEWLWEIYCVDLNHVLTRRYVDYNSASSYASKLAPADDMIKAIMRENYGSLATDTTRSIASTLTIQADASGGQTLRKGFANRRVLDVIQEIAQQSRELGTYISFDVICKQPPTATSTFSAEFRTYVGQRGADRRVTTTNQPLLLGPDFGSMQKVVLDYNGENRITRAIVAGQGVADVRAKARATNTTKAGQSPWGLIEYIEDSRNPDENANFIQNEASGLLKNKQPRLLVQGEFVPTPALLYDVNFGFGDFVPFQVRGQTFDARLSAVSGEYTRDAGETISIVLASSAV